MAHPDSLSGRALNQRARKNTYLQIDRYIATHPEFEQIKDDAKKKVLARVNRFRERPRGCTDAGSWQEGWQVRFVEKLGALEG